jgi:hypothetical protein
MLSHDVDINLNCTGLTVALHEKFHAFYLDQYLLEGKTFHTRHISYVSLKISQVTRQHCYEYIFELVYSAINHGLMNAIAVKKNTNKQTRPSLD